ncbi:ATP phosphoribosyltransferase regulatory subunit [Virgibacillus sp. SK37]|uniref:ATP phosphoribosyltransferase regulatory subunit n=1 Tax=Virgibacillus sp. SK37 TaxID=403957 RepID=UPI0004D0F8B4|nr:ATP phosphoribosyltransferase regulatory subunit [Virgibacillus sp. SK37]AIF42321.1 ATP phosphoribosyltransferase [Virgibacillus sp. SK37]
MKPYVYPANIRNSMEDFLVREELITKLKNRFTTYGYNQVRTPAFEDYDMYSLVSGTVKTDDMIKVIDSTGQVLVLRPDVTTPIARMAALEGNTAVGNLRYFYVLDVFRQANDESRQKEHTQAGIECLGENPPEVDAEVIMLAIHTLRDLNFSNFKIEIGHAGYFKELMEQAAFSKQETEQLQTLIQSKNLAEIEPFLDRFSLNEEIKNAIMAIPLLHGDPNQIIAHAKKYVTNEEMQATLENLSRVIKLVDMYGVRESVSLNLGLINHMNYYTGIIFQGFIDNVGKPILMGGRYDHLGEQFGKTLPAIGFAFHFDLLLQAYEQNKLSVTNVEEEVFQLYYDETQQENALSAACILRNKGYRLIVFPLSKWGNERQPSSKIIKMTIEKKQVQTEVGEFEFKSIDELTSLLSSGKAGV